MLARIAKRKNLDSDDQRPHSTDDSVGINRRSNFRVAGAQLHYFKAIKSGELSRTHSLLEFEAK